MPNSPRIYNGFSRDWITNEIFRRVEPQGRTMSEYLNQELKADFKFEMVMGAKENDWDQYIELNQQGTWSMMKLLFKGPKSYSSMALGEISDSLKCMEAGTAEKKANGMNEFQLSEQFCVAPPKKGS